jgi:hypothetical protein
MALWAIEHTPDFMARINQLGIIQSGWLENEAAITGRSQFNIFLQLFLDSFLTVNYLPSHAFHFSQLPMLDFVTGGVFILGLAYSLFRVKDPRYLLLNGWFWSAVLLGGALVVSAGRSAYRILVLFPAVCLFVAIAWDKLIHLGTRTLSSNWIRNALPTALFIGLLSFFNLKAYFVDYAPTCAYEGENTRLASYIGAYMGELGPTYTHYLMTAPRIDYGTYRSMKYLSGNLTANEIRETITSPLDSIVSNQKYAFYLIPQREDELTYLQRGLPSGKIDRIDECGKTILIVYASADE